MIEVGLAVTTFVTLAGALMGYGELRGKVTAQSKIIDDSINVLRGDIKRLDDRIADLTDFLLKEFRGEDINKIGRKA